MAYYSVLTVTPTTEDWIPAYLPVASALVAQHGGTYVAGMANRDRLEREGASAALRIIIDAQVRTTGSNSHHFPHRRQRRPHPRNRR